MQNDRRAAVSSSSSQQSEALAYIEAHVEKDSLKECSCCPLFTRGGHPNARDFYDQFVVEIFRRQNWPQAKPIQIVDTSSGGLLQTATIVTSLVKAGYKVEVSVIDDGYLNWEFMSNEKPAKKALTNFKSLLEALNADAKEKVVSLNGIFSHVDSYLATVKGDAALKYERVSLEERSRRLRAGEKARYINVDLNLSSNPDRVTERELFLNYSFLKEFNDGSSVRSKLPDLILTIDDITNFMPKLLIPSATSNDKDQNYPASDYAYLNEVVDPLRKLSSQAIFLGTDKRTMELQFIQHDKQVRASVTEFSGAVARELVVNGSAATAENREEVRENSLAQASAEEVNDKKQRISKIKAYLEKYRDELEDRSNLLLDKKNKSRAPGTANPAANVTAWAKYQAIQQMLDLVNVGVNSASPELEKYNELIDKLNLALTQPLDQTRLDPLQLTKHRSAKILKEPLHEVLGNRRYALGFKDTGKAILKGIVTVLATITVIPAVLHYLVAKKYLGKQLFTVKGQDLVKNLDVELTKKPANRIGR